MIKFLAKGDPHSQLKEFRSELEERTEEFAVCVGDNGFYPDLALLEYVDETGSRKAEEKELPLQQFDFTTPWPMPVFTVPGNHEDQEWLDHHYINGMYCPVDNFIFLHATIAKVKEHLYIAGLGKIFVQSTYDDIDQTNLMKYGVRDGRKKIKKWIKKRNHLTSQEVSKFIKEVERFNKKRDWLNDKVIWISHDAPKHRDPENGYPLGSDIIRQLTDLVAPDIALYGHYHHHYEFAKDSMILEKGKLYEVSV